MPCTAEQEPIGETELERAIALLRACWAFFDKVAARVSPEMRRGPRGGGRDGDGIVHHTIRTESEIFARKVGLRIPEAARSPQHREAYVAAMRAYNAGQVARRMRSWTLPFLIRHSAFHTPRPCLGDGGQGTSELRFSNSGWMISSWQRDASRHRELTPFECAAGRLAIPRLTKARSSSVGCC